MAPWQIQPYSEFSGIRGHPHEYWWAVELPSGSKLITHQDRLPEGRPIGSFITPAEAYMYLPENEEVNGIVVPPGSSDILPRIDLRYCTMDGKPRSIPRGQLFTPNPAPSFDLSLAHPYNTFVPQIAPIHGQQNFASYFPLPLQPGQFATTSQFNPSPVQYNHSFSYPPNYERIRLMLENAARERGASNIGGFIITPPTNTQAADATKMTAQSSIKPQQTSDANKSMASKTKGKQRTSSARDKDDNEKLIPSSTGEMLANPETKESAAGKRATMDPFKTLEELKSDEYDEIDVSPDPNNAGSRAPYFIVLNHFDMSKPGQMVPEGPEHSETWFGPYHCIQEVNDATILLAVDRYRDLHMQYYEEYDVKPLLNVRSLDPDGENSLLLVEPQDPRSRFFVCAKATTNEPEDGDDIYEPAATKQGWDIFLASLLITGTNGTKVIDFEDPIMKHKISISRNNANKYAAKMLCEAVEGMLPKSESDEFSEAVKKTISELEDEMMETAERSYEWSFKKTFTSAKKVRDAQGNLVHAKACIKVSVKKYDTDP